MFQKLLRHSQKTNDFWKTEEKCLIKKGRLTKKQTWRFFCKKNKSFWISTFTKEWYNVKNSMMTSYIFEERQIRNCRLFWGFFKVLIKNSQQIFVPCNFGLYWLYPKGMPVQWCILSLTNQFLQKSDDISPRMGFSKPWITCERIHFDISKNNAL